MPNLGNLEAAIALDLCYKAFSISLPHIAELIGYNWKESSYRGQASWLLVL